MTNAIVVILALVAGVWKVGVIRTDVVSSIANHAREDAKEFQRLREELDDTGRSLGETVMAIRQHVNDVELAAAQNYIRREGFYQTMQQMQESITIMRKEIREDIKSLETKIAGRS